MSFWKASLDRAARQRVLTISAGAIVMALAVLTGVALFYYGSTLRGAVAGLEVAAQSQGGATRAGATIPLPRRSAQDIQSSIDRASDGAVVEVPAGLYEGAIDFRGKRVVLRSREGAERTILDGRNTTGPIVTIRNIAGSNARTPELRGFTIRNGRGPGGVGVLVERADPVIADCVIEGNGDGGLRLVESGAVVDLCRVAGNLTLMLGGGAQCIGGAPSFVNTIFQDNTARAGGGAIACQGGAPIILVSRFEGNRAVSGAWGGALYIQDATLTVIDSEFLRNGSSEEGGAIYLRGGNARIERSSFEANSARSAWSILGDGATVSVRTTRFCGPLEWNVRAASLDERDNSFATDCIRDCNGNGVADDIEIENGTVSDCDESGVPDPCKIDCDGDGIPDACAIAMGLVRDGNENGIPDACEQAMGLLSHFPSNGWEPSQPIGQSEEHPPARADGFRD